MRTKTVILLLVFTGLTVYFNSLLNGFVKDDFIQIIDNTKVHSVINIPQIFAGSTNAAGGADKIAGIFYRPLMLSIYSVLYTLFGPAPFFFHLFQLLLHIANALLVYFFIKRFFKNITAFFIALIFLIHPVNNEAVVYIANLQEILFFFFGMLALLIINNGKKISIKRYTLIFILLFLSLLSKESAVLFLAISVIYSFLFKRGKIIILLTGNVIVFIFYLLLRYGVAKMYNAQESVAPISQAPLFERLLHIPAIITYYLKTFFFPVQLGADQFWFIHKFTLENFLPLLTISIILLIILSAGGVMFYKKYRKLFTTYLFFYIWFLIGLGLHLQIIKLDATVADRWFYFPIVGFISLIVLIIKNFNLNFPSPIRRSLEKASAHEVRGQGEVWSLNKIIQRSGIVIIVLLIIFFSYQTFQRNYDWYDELTLFAHDINVTPRNFILDNLYATALIRNDEFDEAKPYAVSSVKEHPFYANLNNMAIIYASEKNYKEAKKYLKEAVDVSQNYAVYENYSNFLLVFDDLNEAEVFTKKALKMFPENAKLWMIMAKVQYLEGNKKGAVKSAEKAYKIFSSEENKKILTAIKNDALNDIRKKIKF